MNVFLSKNRRNRLLLFPFCLVLLSLLFLSGCHKKLNYFDYVSELRSNIFLAETEDFSLRIYAVEKETPYAMDGVPQETSPRLEAYLVAPSGNQTMNLHFEIDGKTMGGEMSYDNVKCEYFYSCTLDVSALREIPCALTYGEENLALTAISILTEQALAPKVALEKLIQENSELFSSMTDDYGFAGEIYLRLIHEDNAYYYIGVISREGKVNAFLMNAETGKILAKRQN